MKKVLKMKDDEISMFDFFSKLTDWDKMDAQKRNTIAIALTLIMSCVENDKINTDKLGEITAKVHGGKMDFA